MTDLNELIERLERAPEGSRELDGTIRACVVGDFYYCDYETGTYCAEPECSDPGCGSPQGIIDERMSYPQDWRDDERLPHYTTSIDAARSLVPEGQFFSVMAIFYEEAGTEKYEAMIHLPDYTRWQPIDNRWVEMTGHCYRGNTPALALCTAALKAQEADNAED